MMKILSSDKMMSDRRTDFKWKGDSGWGVIYLLIALIVAVLFLFTVVKPMFRESSRFVESSLGMIFLGGFLKKKKGQVEGPIELMVGIIIFAMALAIGFYVMNMVKKSECDKLVRNLMERISLSMQDIAISSSGTKKTVILELPRCKGKIVGIRFAYYKEPQYCRDCKGLYGSCWKIEPLIYDNKIKSVVVFREASSCVNIGGNMRIEADTSDNALVGNNNPCPSLQRFNCNNNDVYPSSINENWPILTYSTEDSDFYILTLEKSSQIEGTEEYGLIKVRLTRK